MCSAMRARRSVGGFAVLLPVLCEWLWSSKWSMLQRWSEGWRFFRPGNSMCMRLPDAHVPGMEAFPLICSDVPRSPESSRERHRSPRSSGCVGLRLYSRSRSAGIVSLVLALGLAAAGCLIGAVVLSRGGDRCAALWML